MQSCIGNAYIAKVAELLGDLSGYRPVLAGSSFQLSRAQDSMLHR